MQKPRGWEPLAKADRYIFRDASTGHAAALAQYFADEGSIDFPTFWRNAANDTNREEDWD
jgi:hypothetical protein